MLSASKQWALKTNVSCLWGHAFGHRAVMWCSPPSASNWGDYYGVLSGQYQQDWAGREAEIQCPTRKAAVSLHRALEWEEAVPHWGEKMGPPITGAGSLRRWHGLARWFSSAGATSQQGCLLSTIFQDSPRTKSRVGVGVVVGARTQCRYEQWMTASPKSTPLFWSTSSFRSWNHSRFLFLE